MNEKIIFFYFYDILIQIKEWLTIAWFDRIKFISSKIVGRETVSPWQGRRAVEIAEKFSKVCKRSNCSSGRVRGGLIIDSSIHHHVVIISWVINWSIGVRWLHYQIIIILKREMALSAKKHCIMIELFTLKEISYIWWSFYYSNLLLFTFWVEGAQLQHVQDPSFLLPPNFHFQKCWNFRLQYLTFVRHFYFVHCFLVF